ncbi:hypothetical protein [Methanobacterium aggregans]|uniref:hypothetical protein n=1 Tax=Methanobacterium aggregans TaxID=1615586 RepID=UPI001AE6771C|nr:hypothetical protein [Methanobacterium aggregans]MBP2047064.1 hypothetical protein [Methanobacterium aggregans]
MINPVTAVPAGISTAQVMNYTTVSMGLLVVLLMVVVVCSKIENQHVKYLVKGSYIAILPLFLMFVVLVAYRAVIAPI